MKYKKNIKNISYKKKESFENRLSDSIFKLRELWKALKSLVLPSKTSVCGTTALKVKNKKGPKLTLQITGQYRCYL